MSWQRVCIRLLLAIVLGSFLSIPPVALSLAETPRPPSAAGIEWAGPQPFPGILFPSAMVVDSPRLESLQPPQEKRSPRHPSQRVIRRRRRRSPRRQRPAHPASLPREDAAEEAEEAKKTASSPEVQPLVASSHPALPAVSTASVSAKGEVKAWITQELAAVDLGDRRLERRLVQIVERLASQPEASIPKACGSAAATKAAYRFFANRRVSPSAIVQGHRMATLQRMSDHSLILVLQDTTSLDYTHHPKTQGLGPLETKGRHGLLVHTSLACSEDGVPLGLLDQQVWRRDPQTVGQRHQRKERPTEAKESAKWLCGVRASLEGVPASVCVVTVGDREADIFDFFREAFLRDTQVLVRAAWNRRVAQPTGCLWEEAARTPVQGEEIIEVGRAKDRLPRQARATIRFTAVQVCPPRHRRKEAGLQPLPLYAIEVREETPPPKEKGIHWLLLTNRPVTDLEEARRLVRWYGLRWLVERYHFVLKSGCRIEERQLETGERLERCLAVYAVVAWRLLWATYFQDPVAAQRLNPFPQNPPAVPGGGRRIPPAAERRCLDGLVDSAGR